MQTSTRTNGNSASIPACLAELIYRLMEEDRKRQMSEMRGSLLEVLAGVGGQKKEKPEDAKAREDAAKAVHGSAK